MGWAAVCQMTSTNNMQKNIDQASGLVEKASGRGADMVFLPEAFDLIGESSKETLDLAQELDGSIISQMKKLALDHKVWLSLGGFHNKEKSSDVKIFNTHIIINNEGQLVETYNKCHLFDVEIPGKFRLMESDYVKAGQHTPLPVRTPIGLVGLSVCYDLRFPELSIGLRSLGADILTFPSAFTIPTGMAHWKPLLQARAIENQCYVIAAAQTGKHNQKRSSYGHAMIVDPWGTVIAECREGISFAMAEIDLTYLEKIRQDMPVAAQRRTDLYGQISLPSTSGPGLPEDDWIFSFGPAKVRGASVVYRTASSIVFVNKKPVQPGHLLVSPLRRNTKSLIDLTNAEITDLFTTVKLTEVFLLKEFDTDSCTISIQDGPAAGQTIDHLHVHLIPRQHGDFQNNDDIYRELEEHDKQTSGWRDQSAMADEAKRFRRSWEANTNSQL